MISSTPNPLAGRASRHILDLLDKLHSLSETQEAGIDPNNKLPQLSIVEAGTSFGVSTIYLSLAVGANLGGQKGKGRVVGTEKEPSKAAQARRHWEQCGDEVTDFIELREGDLLETLKNDLDDVDLLLLDIWAPLALPTLKTVLPKLRPRAVVLVDDTAVSMMPGGYKDLLAYLRQEGSGFSNLTVPYSKGLEMCVYLPRN